MFGIYLKDEINLSAGTMWIQIRPNASEKWKLIIGICKFFHQMESVDIFGGVCHRHCVNWIWNSEENWRQRPWILDFHLNLTMSNTERRRRRLWKVLWTACKRHFVKKTINFSDSEVRILRSDGISWQSAVSQSVMFSAIASSGLIFQHSLAQTLICYHIISVHNIKLLWSVFGPFSMQNNNAWIHQTPRSWCFNSLPASKRQQRNTR